MKEECRQVNALLFETRSIQQYIFSSNQMKTNIGASYLVDKLFHDILMEKILADEMKLVIGGEAQNVQTERSQIWQASGIDGEMAYSGGGNALLLLNPKRVSDEKVKEIVRRFTRYLLIHRPGLRTGVACGKLTLGDRDAFKENLCQLYRQLKNNQKMVVPQVKLSDSGLTAPSEQEIEVEVKKQAAKEANKALSQRFSSLLQQEERTYFFPEELAKLGQVETENYIAVVHIDGNNMGEKFSECEDLAERSALSAGVKKRVEEAFGDLLESIIGEYERYAMTPSKVALDENQLPIRPLILGGDDVTFVCMGRAGIIYAKRFVEAMRRQPVTYGAKHLTVECCAGVAIVPTMYPFFRAYQLAEQLCGAAKLQSRLQPGSWLDYTVLHGEQAPTLAQIRRQEYSGKMGNLHFGPYKIGDPDYHFAIEKLLAGAAKMKELLRNKVKEMRFVLAKGIHDIRQFKDQLDKQCCLPKIAGYEVYEKEFWHTHDGNEAEMRTPYLDMIEIGDFVLPEEGSVNHEED